VAAEDEARELVDAATEAAPGTRRRPGPDAAVLERLVARRLAGEPLAWVSGRADFDGLELRVDPGVYVPRWQSRTLARRAAARLPERGAALDLCTGSGAVAAALQRARPEARVVATDTDPRAVACARRNGVDALLGDLFAPVPGEFRGRTNVVVAVVPYVPTPELALLPRDTLRFEDAAHYDGGPDGTDVLRRLVAGAPRFLRTGGALVLEIGGQQSELLRPVLARHHFTGVETWVDEDGDLRGVAARLG